MKNKLIFGLLAILCLALTGCSENSSLGRLGWFDIKDGPGMEREIDEGGEWFSVAEGYCADEGGELEIWEEGGDNQPVCYFKDNESYCYFEDLYDGLCHKGDLHYYDDLYPYAEQACIDSNGQISQTDDGEDICILNDEEFCYMSDVMDGACDLLYQDYDYYEDLADCDAEGENIVCGTDGNTYFNKCYLDFAGVEEETVAEVVDGVCVFG